VVAIALAGASSTAMADSNLEVVALADRWHEVPRGPQL
jgi:hypothetical protein